MTDRDGLLANITAAQHGITRQEFSLARAKRKLACQMIRLRRLDEAQCKCFARMGNDFYFLPTGACLYPRKWPACATSAAAAVPPTASDILEAKLGHAKPPKTCKFCGGDCGQCGGVTDEEPTTAEDVARWPNNHEVTCASRSGGWIAGRCNCRLARIDPPVKKWWAWVRRMLDEGI